MRHPWSLFLHAIRLRRTPSWRRDLRSWAAANIEPQLASPRGSEYVRATRDAVIPPLAPLLQALRGGAFVLDEPAFANRLKSALNRIAFDPEITARGAKLRAYCDIGATLVILDALIARMAAELALAESDVALRLAAAAGDWREPHVVAGRHLLRLGRHEEAIACARKAIEIVSSCPASQQLLLEGLRARKNAGGSVTPVEENGLADLRGRFCARPFEVIVSGQGVRFNAETQLTEQVMGATYACDCAAWVPYVTGNMIEAESADAAWNSPGMQEVRRSILDGEFSYCSRTLCPRITTASLPLTEEVTSPRLQRIIANRETVVTDPPLLVSLGHDSSCNLACPTCRHDLVMANVQQTEVLNGARDRVILPLLRNAQIGLHLTAWGDPFASRHYRSILEALGAPEYDGVKLYLLTNGLGLTRHTWKTMPHLAEKIVELRVSVDAATKETYENVRRPGRWDVLRENLTAMGELNRTGVFRQNRSTDGGYAVSTHLEGATYSFVIAFVVQSANFREMPEFAALGEEIGADVVFQKYYNFGHEAPTLFAAKDVTSPLHPEHPALLKILDDPAMQKPHVVQVFLPQLENATL